MRLASTAVVIDLRAFSSSFALLDTELCAAAASPLPSLHMPSNRTRIDRRFSNHAAHTVRVSTIPCYPVRYPDEHPKQKFVRAPYHAHWHVHAHVGVRSCYTPTRQANCTSQPFFCVCYHAQLTVTKIDYHSALCTCGVGNRQTIKMKGASTQWGVGGGVQWWWGDGGSALTSCASKCRSCRC